MDIKKTANLLIKFAIKRLAEIFGILIFTAGALLLIALITYSPEDPNFIFPENRDIKNILGFKGSFISDLFFQSVGLISYLFSFTFILTGLNVFRFNEFYLIKTDNKLRQSGKLNIKKIVYKLSKKFRIKSNINQYFDKNRIIRFI